MGVYASIADRNAIEAEAPWDQRDKARTIYEFLSRTAVAHGSRKAVSFQLLSGPKDKAKTLTWSELKDQVTQAANLFRSLGIGEADAIAFVLPNSLETVATLLGGMVAGDREPDQPAAGTRTDRGHPAGNESQGRRHPAGVPQDRCLAESGRGGAPRARRHDGARG